MKKELAENNFIAINYMNSSIDMKNHLFKVPLKKIYQIKDEKYYKLQKLPDVIPKKLLPQKDLKPGYENVAFTGLDFVRPTLTYENKITTGVKFLKKDKLEETTAYSLLTGGINSLVVVDLDINKPKWDELKNNHPFIEYYNKKYNLEPNKDFKISLINILDKINTYTVKSPNGYHIYFKSDKAEDYKSTQAPDLEIDIRGEGGLIIGAFTQLKTMDNKTVEYKPYLDIPVIDVEEHDEFINIVYNSNGNKNSTKKSNAKSKSNIKRETNYNLYKYQIDNDILKSIEDSLNLDDFKDTLEWLKLTSFLSILL